MLQFIRSKCCFISSTCTPAPRLGGTVYQFVHAHEMEHDVCRVLGLRGRTSKRTMVVQDTRPRSRPRTSTALVVREPHPCPYIPPLPTLLVLTSPSCATAIPPPPGTTAAPALPAPAACPPRVEEPTSSCANLPAPPLALPAAAIPVEPAVETPVEPTMAPAGPGAVAGLTAAAAGPGTAGGLAAVAGPTADPALAPVPSAPHIPVSAALELLDRQAATHRDSLAAQ